MNRFKLMTAIVVLALVGPPASVQAQRHGGGSARQGGHSVSRPGGGALSGHAVPRGSVPVRPPITGPYRSYGRYPYYYPYYRGFGLGFYYRYPGYYGYPFGYFAYGYPGYGSPAYGYGYGYGGYGYGGYSGYITAAPREAAGRIRIQDAPSDAQVFADGYYVGVVDEFDGAFQYLNLEAGVHQIEIVAPGFETLTFDVNVQPGQTITYRAHVRPIQP